jgi:lysophospholipid acyltransferase (LPLAT)-like uncharacterized protein
VPKPTLLHRVAAAIAAFYLHLVGRTSFVETWDHPSYLPFRRERRPMIFGFWHNTQVFLSYHHRHEPTINIMVSQSKDGEYIARVMDWMGMRAIRGSSSRGGLRAFVDIMQRAEAGEQIGFTPDGPRGPAHSVQDGIVVAAKRSGLPIVPLHTLSRRRMTFKTWDQFMVPLPFSHMIVSHGRPFRLTESDSDDVAKEKVKAFLEKNQMVCEEALESAPSYLVSVYAYVLLCFYNVALTFLFPVVVLSLMLKFGFKRSLSGIGDRLGLSKPSVHGKKRSWFHAASLGEWQALKPLMAVIRRMGQKNFETHFLRAEKELDVAGMATSLGLTEAEVQKVRDFLLTYSIQSEFFDPSSRSCLCGLVFAISRPPSILAGSL